MVKVYTYSNCSTCKNATKFLKQKNISFTEIPIRETPPSIPELQRMLKSYDGNIRKLFNTSGLDYKSMGLSEKLPSMSVADSLQLLSKNGNLVKRPFLLTESKGVVGFKEDKWKQIL